MDLLYQSDYDIIQNYDIVDCYIIYNITYDGCVSRSSPLPGLHSGLDSFRFSPIASEKHTFHCRARAGCILLLTR